MSTEQSANRQSCLPGRYHLAGTYDGQDLRIYLNGQEEDRVHCDIGIDFSFFKLYLGHESLGRIEGFDGLLDEIVFFDRPISPEEVDTIYRMGTQGKSTSK